MCLISHGPHNPLLEVPSIDRSAPLFSGWVCFTFAFLCHYYWLSGTGTLLGGFVFHFSFSLLVQGLEFPLQMGLVDMMVIWQRKEGDGRRYSRNGGVTERFENETSGGVWVNVWLNAGLNPVVLITNQARFLLLESRRNAPMA